MLISVQELQNYNLRGEEEEEKIKCTPHFTMKAFLKGYMRSDFFCDYLPVAQNL